MGFFRNIGDFLSCLLRENCEYSIKKILTYIFSFLAFYVIIFTDKEYYEILLFIGALLGIRGYERVKLWGKTPDPPIEPGLTDDSMLGSKKSKKGGKQLLTD